MGKVIMSGRVPKLEAPSLGLMASDLAVGSSVYLNENGSPVEYLVVNQGIPSSSSLYDSSCSGTWLLRKDIYTTMAWDSASNEGYQNSDVHSYLNGTFLSLFDTNTQSAIKQVKIPHISSPGSYAGNATVSSGINGLSTKVFLLSPREFGFSDYYAPTADGACLNYFSGCSVVNELKHVTNYNGASMTGYWTRSSPLESIAVMYVHCTYPNPYGNFTSLSSTSVEGVYGIRPALILPSTAKFYEETLLFKGA